DGARLRFLPDVAYGSFAIGSSQQQVRPCPLCPDSDQIPQRSEMTRCARSGSGLPSFGHLIDSGVLLTLDRTGVEIFSADPLKPKSGFFIFPSPPWGGVPNAVTGWGIENGHRSCP